MTAFDQINSDYDDKLVDDLTKLRRTNNQLGSVIDIQLDTLDEINGSFMDLHDYFQNSILMHILHTLDHRYGPF